MQLPDKLLARRSANLIPAFPTQLEGATVLLQPVDVARDCEALYAASNGSGPAGEANAYDPHKLIWQYMFGGPYPDLESFRDYLSDLQNTCNGLALCVRHRAKDTVAGLATYCSNVPEALRIELGGIWYNPSFQRSSVNTETIYLMLRHAFEQLGYRRVEWKCDAGNERSKVAAQRLGFSYEGTFRQHMIVKNINRDTAWFAITDQDWPTIKANLETRLNR